MNAGICIKNKREEMGLTQAKLAELANCSERTVRRLEGKGEISETSTVKRIVEVLGLRTSVLYDKGKLVLSFEVNDYENEDILNELGCSNTTEVFNGLKKSLKEAREFYKNKKYSESLKIYLSLIEVFPSGKIYLNIAIIYYDNGEYEKCIEFSDKLINMNLYIYEALNLKGLSLSNIERYEESIETLLKAADISRKYNDYYNLGVVYGISGNNDKAIEYYKKCIEINPDYASTHLNISVCYFEELRLDKSLYHINEAIRLDPDMYKAYGRKGEYYRFIDDFDCAIESFKICLSKDPENYQALLGMGMIYAAEDNFNECSKYFKEFFKLYSDNYFNSDKKKSILIDIGYKTTRVLELEKVSNDTYRVNLGRAAFEVKVNSEGSLIYIGCMKIADDTGEILYPVIGKVYKDKAEYDKCVSIIKNTVEIVKASDKYPLYVKFEKQISINITELEDCIDIKIVFENEYKYTIIGLTDTKGEGFKAFVEEFNKYKQCRLQIEFSENDIFIIDCIENMTINRFKKDN